MNEGVPTPITALRYLEIVQCARVVLCVRPLYDNILLLEYFSLFLVLLPQDYVHRNKANREKTKSPVESEKSLSVPSDGELNF